MQSLFNLCPNVIMRSRDDGAFTHDEADVTMIAYMLQAAKLGKDVMRILSDSADVFVMLVYWVWKMERWNGVVVDINATCTELGPKCSDLMETGQRFFAALYGQPLGTTMSEAHYREDGKAYVQHGITTDRSEPIISMFA